MIRTVYFAAIHTFTSLQEIIYKNLFSTTETYEWRCKEDWLCLALLILFNALLSYSLTRNHRKRTRGLVKHMFTLHRFVVAPPESSPSERVRQGRAIWGSRRAAPIRLSLRTLASWPHENLYQSTPHATRGTWNTTTKDTISSVVWRRICITQSRIYLSSTATLSTKTDRQVWSAESNLGQTDVQ